LPFYDAAGRRPSSNVHKAWISGDSLSRNDLIGKNVLCLRVELRRVVIDDLEVSGRFSDQDELARRFHFSSVDPACIFDALDKLFE
ncbi:MAG TPA: hypothetical protein VNN25_14480, partial [Thermoanaerobaculia bacterium]|nr:hypothetical protein [Thermoanaerobaculia bacterium]